MMWLKEVIAAMFSATVFWQHFHSKSMWEWVHTSECEKHSRTDQNRSVVVERYWFRKERSEAFVLLKTMKRAWRPLPMLSRRDFVCRYGNSSVRFTCCLFSESELSFTASCDEYLPERNLSHTETSYSCSPSDTFYAWLCVDIARRYRSEQGLRQWPLRSNLFSGTILLSETDLEVSLNSISNRQARATRGFLFYYAAGANPPIEEFSSMGADSSLFITSMTMLSFWFLLCHLTSWLFREWRSLRYGLSKSPAPQYPATAHFPITAHRYCM
jgi:hypothetical protein